MAVRRQIVGRDPPAIGDKIGIVAAQAIISGILKCEDFPLRRPAPDGTVRKHRGMNRGYRPCRGRHR